MVTIGGYVTEQIISEGHLFRSIMQQNLIENEFNCYNVLLKTI